MLTTQIPEPQLDAFVLEEALNRWQPAQKPFRLVHDGEAGTLTRDFQLAPLDALLRLMAWRRRRSSFRRSQVLLQWFGRRARLWVSSLPAELIRGVEWNQSNVTAAIRE
jgi:hypothetical protein